MPPWILKIVIQFVLRQIVQFGHSIDWGKIKSDLDIRIRKLLPDWMEDAAIACVNAAIDAIALVLDTADKMKPLLDLLAEHKYAEAEKMLVDLLKAHFSSHVSLAQSQVKDMVLEMAV